jgi:glutathione synthase/RimK-type ligase-like ATP-grasp enzyme
VLLVSHDRDEHALAVAAHLVNRGVEPALVDLAQLPSTGLSIHLGAGRPGRFLLGSGLGQVDPSASLAVWWRRPRRPEAPADLDAGARRLFDGEWRHALDGLIHAAPGFWVNDPTREEPASKKLVQLEAARRVGLPVPRTLVTGVLAEARAFLGSCRRGAVVKSLASLREGGLTRRTTARDSRLAARLAVGPAILQERVEGIDVRVTAVGRRLFAMAVDARAGSDEDDVRADFWRAAATARPVEVPPDLARRLLALQRRLGLSYGAIDLRRRPGGGWVFLEVNPSGQWLHAEAVTGQPITAALATLLARGGVGRG